MPNTGSNPASELFDDRVACPHCGIRFSIPDSLAGGVVYCLACGRRFQTPITSVIRPPVLEAYASADGTDTVAAAVSTGEVIWRGRPSRWKQAGWYLSSLLLFAGGASLAVWKWTVGTTTANECIAAWIPAGSGLLLLTGVLLVAVAEIRRLQYFYVIGKTELTASKGLLNIELSRVLVRDIRSLNLRACLWERIVGICDMDIGTAGTSGVEMKLIAIPRRVGEALRHARGG